MKKLIGVLTVAFLMLLVCSASFADEVVRYVNTESTAGGDGTTAAITGVNRAYASLSEWEAAEQTDLVTDGDTHIVHCDADDGSGSHSADTTAVVIDGWTTGASNYITIQVDSDKRHDGKWDTSAYRIELSGTYDYFTIAQDYTVVKGLQIKPTYDSSSYGRTLIRSDNQGVDHITVAYCIIDCGSGNTGTNGIYLDGEYNHVYNNLIYGTSYHDAITLRATANSQYIGEIYNCTATGSCRYGIQWYDHSYTGLTGRGYNNLADGTFSSGSYHSLGNVSFTGYTNLSSDSSAPGTNPVTNSNVTFVGSGDYHLDPNDTYAKDAGTDMSSDTYLSFSDDIDGETRSSTWDIGADEYVAASTSNLSKIGDTDLSDVGSIADEAKSDIGKIGDEEL